MIVESFLVVRFSGKIDLVFHEIFPEETHDERNRGQNPIEGKYAQNAENDGADRDDGRILEMGRVEGRLPSHFREVEESTTQTPDSIEFFIES